MSSFNFGNFSSALSAAEETGVSFEGRAAKWESREAGECDLELEQQLIPQCTPSDPQMFNSQLFPFISSHPIVLLQPATSSPK